MRECLIWAGPDGWPIQEWPVRGDGTVSDTFASRFAVARSGLGWRGFRTLSRLIAEAWSAGLLVILDVKRGDVGSTNEAYPEAFLGPAAPLAADTVTVHPYPGLAAIDAFVSRAHRAGSCLLVVTRSANPQGRAVQSACDGDGRQVDERLLGEIGELNRMLAPGQIGPVGAVVGLATIEPDLGLPGARALFLAPAWARKGLSQDVAGSSQPVPPG